MKAGQLIKYCPRCHKRRTHNLRPAGMVQCSKCGRARSLKVTKDLRRFKVNCTARKRTILAVLLLVVTLSILTAGFAVNWGTPRTTVEKIPIKIWFAVVDYDTVHLPEVVEVLHRHWLYDTFEKTGDYTWRSQERYDFTVEVTRNWVGEIIRSRVYAQCLETFLEEGYFIHLVAYGHYDILQPICTGEEETHEGSPIAWLPFPTNDVFPQKRSIDGVVYVGTINGSPNSLGTRVPVLMDDETGNLFLIYGGDLSLKNAVTTHLHIRAYIIAQGSLSWKDAVCTMNGPNGMTINACPSTFILVSGWTQLD